MKRISSIILAIVMVISFATSAFAATKKPIKTVTITAKYIMSSGSDEFNEDEDEGFVISASGTGYEFENYESKGEEFYDEDDTGSSHSAGDPEIVIYLAARDGYYFNITKASQIKLRGCTYKSAARQNSSTTLAVTVVVTDVERAIGEVEEMKLSDKGVCSWEPVGGAGSYEVRFMRDTTRVGGTQTVQGTSLDCGQYLIRGGTYHFQIRAVHADDPTVKGDWADSPDIYVSDAQAKEYREAAEAAESAGDWIPDKNGWRFRLPDGTFVANAWRKINKEWYYFLPNSYIARGWTQIDGSWYYLDPATGKMWVNTTTPDGYTLGIDGRRAE